MLRATLLRFEPLLRQLFHAALGLRASLREGRFALEREAVILWNSVEQDGAAFDAPAVRLCRRGLRLAKNLSPLRDRRSRPGRAAHPAAPDRL